MVEPRWQGKQRALAEEVCATELAGLFGAADDLGKEVAVGGVGDATNEVGFERAIGTGGVDVVNAADEVGFPDAWGSRGDATSEVGFEMPQVKMALPLV